MIWAPSVPCGSVSSSTLGRWRRSRPSASFIAIRDSQVAQAEIAAKAVQMREGADVGLLHDVLGLAVVAQDAAGEAVEPAVVRLHDRADRRLVAAQRRGEPARRRRCGAGNQPGLSLLQHAPALRHSTVRRLDAAKPIRFPK